MGTALEARLGASTSDLLQKAARQFDPSDPTSPMAKHAATSATHQEKVADLIQKGHAELGAKVDELSTALRIQEARSSLASVTPIKGATFEDQIHDLMRDIAAGVADEYEDTTSTVGLVSRSKKGDGLLRIASDSARSGWTDYFDEAERNRGAVAGIGVVRSIGQNAGKTVRALGPRRIVIAFDPDRDDPELLRTSSCWCAHRRSRSPPAAAEPRSPRRRRRSPRRSTSWARSTR